MASANGLMDEKYDDDGPPPGLEPVEQKMDLSGLDAVPLKKTLLMVNSFVLNTTAFLNKFASLCESKLTKLSGDIQRVEIVLALLEAKLNSIPWLESAPPPTAPGAGGPPPPPPDAVAGGGAAAPGAAGAPPAPPPDAVPGGAAAAAPPGPPPAPGAAAPGAPPVPPPGAGPAPPDPNAGALVPVEQPEEVPMQNALENDPRYKSYFKMLKLGVVKEQIKQRMMMDGVDPSILDNPAAAPAPSAAAAAMPPPMDDDDDSEEDDEFESD